MLVHQEVKQCDEARREFGVLAEGAYAAFFKVKPNGANVQNVFAVARQERLDAIDQFLHGERQGQYGVGYIFINGLVVFQDKNDWQFGIFFAKRLANP